MGAVLLGIHFIIKKQYLADHQSQRLILFCPMQTDKQQITRLATSVRKLEQQMLSKGIALNPRVLWESSEDDEPANDEGYTGKGTFQSKMNQTLKEYQFRKKFNEDWFRSKLEVLYRTYNKRGSQAQ